MQGTRLGIALATGLLLVSKTLCAQAMVSKEAVAMDGGSGYHHLYLRVPVHPKVDLDHCVVCTRVRSSYPRVARATTIRSAAVAEAVAAEVEDSVRQGRHTTYAENPWPLNFQDL